MCLLEKTGSCLGCNILQMGINKVRWEGMTLPQAQQALQASQHCPPGLTPQVDKLVNKWANFAMGQQQEENLEGLTNIRKHKRFF